LLKVLYTYPAGWAMQMACFVFIQRRWEDDRKHMESMLGYFCDIREPLQLLLFPEGTDLTGNVFFIFF
jgi:lysocardiolipin and lysophospholipid acyltransferase